MSDTPYPELPLTDTAWLTALARTLTRDTALADDLVQDTWVAAMRSGPPEGGFGRAWLSSVLRRIHLNSLRSGRRRAHREGVAARQEAIPSTQELIERTELQQTLAQCLLDLEEPYRSTLMLVVFEGLSTTEIAGRDGVSAGIVRYRIRKAREQMRQRLESTGEGGWSRWHAALLPFAQLPLPHEVGPGGAAELISKSPSAGAATSVASLAPALALLMTKTVWIATAAILLVGLGLRELATTDSQPGLSPGASGLTTGEATLADAQPSNTGSIDTRSAIDSSPAAPPVQEEDAALPESDQLILHGAIRTPEGIIPQGSTVLYLPPGFAPFANTEQLETARIDDQGRFELTFDAWTAGRLVVGSPGFGSISLDPWGDDFDPEQTRTVDLGEIVLAPGATVSGQVSRNGDLLKAGRVRASLVSEPGPKPSSTLSEFAISEDGRIARWEVTAPIDAGGRFELTGLEPGLQYRLVALSSDNPVLERRSAEPNGIAVLAPASGVVLEWELRRVQFIVTSNGEPVPFPGVWTAIDPGDPRRNEPIYLQDGLVMPIYGDELGRIDAVIAATDRQTLRFKAPGYELLELPFDPESLPADGAIQVRLFKESERTQLYVRFVGPTPGELEGLEMRLSYASKARGMESSAPVPIRDGVAHFESLPPEFMAGFFALLSPDADPSQSADSLPFFEVYSDFSALFPPGYLRLEERLKAGEIGEVEVEIEIGGRLEVSLIQRDPNLPAPQLEVIDSLGNRTPFAVPGEAGGPASSRFLKVGEYTFKQVGPHYPNREEKFEIREREVTPIQFNLQL